MRVKLYNAKVTEKIQNYQRKERFTHEKNENQQQAFEHLWRSEDKKEDLQRIRERTAKASRAELSFNGEVRQAISLRPRASPLRQCCPSGPHHPGEGVFTHRPRWAQGILGLGWDPLNLHF